MKEDKAEISVITATYNRSNCLRYSIESLLGQRCSRSWEHLVIGDACTDDSARLVASFNDRRLRFFNLEKNCGEQSGPNNEGFRLACGRYIAYLNHDDLWFPDHLEKALDYLEANRLDGVFTLGAALDPDGAARLLSSARSGLYYPDRLVPASLWLLRREVPEALGGWRPAAGLFTIPSQDFLVRAWKQGFRIGRVPALTAVCIQSGRRPGCYSERQEDEQAAALENIRRGEAYRIELLGRVLLDCLDREQSAGPGAVLRRLGAVMIKRLALLAGLTPVQLRDFFQSRRRGGKIRRLRRKRGLPPGY